MKKPLIFTLTSVGGKLTTVTVTYCLWICFRLIINQLPLFVKHFFTKISFHKICVKLNAYGLRHTYCTMLNNCGIGEYFKKRLMGYTLKDSISDSVYTHSTEFDLIKTAKPILKEFGKIFKNAFKNSEPPRTKNPMGDF